MINDPVHLTNELPRLRAATWLAMDTEADSLHSYPEKLCLIQLSFDGGHLVIDPLAPLELAPLLSILQDREVILHGADYDLRLLYRTFGFAPNAIFETMLAARFLGHRQFGLTDLVFKYLGVKLEKGPQKANWSRRPLTDRMLAYAVNDTRHLHPLADALRQELDRLGRSDWHREACLQLIEDCRQPRSRDPDSQWRVKGSERLSRRSLGILRELWLWREEEAIRANRPPYFVLSHEWLVHGAEAMTVSDLHGRFPQHLTPRRRESLVEAFQRGQALPHSEWPERLRYRNHRLTDAENRGLAELIKRRDHWAVELGLDPAFVASRSTLLTAACAHRLNTDGLMNWQRRLLFPQ